MSEKIENTYWSEICMAGDYDFAKQALREYMSTHKACVTLTATDYIYHGGLEAGIIVRLVNYPRFPKSEDDIDDFIYDLGQFLMKKLHQQTCLIVSPEYTTWINNRYND